MVPALLVIGLGVFFLLGNLGIRVPLFDLRDWWAWLILAAAIVPLSDAARSYQSRRVIDDSVLQPLLTATVIIMVALMFLLHLSWRQWWPVFVIYGGLSMLVRSRRSPRDDEPQ